MAEPTLVEQAALLSSTLEAIEDRLARATGPIEGLEDFKSALDDMRLRLWGLVSSAGGVDYKGFQERFRIQRATEMCRGLNRALRGGQVSGRRPELTALHAAASELNRCIEQARQHAF
jgi:hypothetical protein